MLKWRQRNGQGQKGKQGKRQAWRKENGTEGESRAEGKRGGSEN